MQSKVIFFGFEERAAMSEVTKHKHGCDELVYYLAGDGSLIINGKTYPLRGNSFSFIKAGAVHSEIHRKNGTVLFIGFDCAKYSNSFDEGCFALPVSSPVPAILNSLLDEGRNTLLFRDDMMTAKLNEALVCLIRIMHAGVRGRKSLSYAVSFIDENYMHKIDLQELAKSCGYGYDFFRHEFQRLTKLPPSKYIISKRLLTAMELLSSSDLDCTQVAYQCGFSSSAQLSTMFKSRFGVSPSSVRKGYVGSGERVALRAIDGDIQDK